MDALLKSETIQRCFFACCFHTPYPSLLPALVLKKRFHSPFWSKAQTVGWQRRFPLGKGAPSGGGGSEEGTCRFITELQNHCLQYVSWEGWQVFWFYFFPQNVDFHFTHVPSFLSSAVFSHLYPVALISLFLSFQMCFKAQQMLIQSNTNFPVCCIIKCSAWFVHSPPVIKCQLQQCLVPPGSSCCHFHFPPRTKHLKTKKS